MSVSSTSHNYAINDEGTYGYVTRSLINAQASATGNLPEADLHHSAGSMLRIRQLSMLQDSDLKLWNQSEQQDVNLIPTPILSLCAAKETTTNAWCPRQHGARAVSETWPCHSWLLASLN
jgi:hypothetical protein